MWSRYLLQEQTAQVLKDQVRRFHHQPHPPPHARTLDAVVEGSTYVAFAAAPCVDCTTVHVPAGATNTIQQLHACAQTAYPWWSCLPGAAQGNLRLK